MRNVVSLFGSDNVFILSADDKAKTPFCVTAVRKQASLLSMHKLTLYIPHARLSPFPSSKADLEKIYSGPTYIAVSSSTAYTHGRNFDHLFVTRV